MSNLIQENILLAPRTTIKLGGAARYFVVATSIEEVQEALVFAAEHSLLLHILGGGSNTIFSDSGFDGLVLHIALPGIAISDSGLVVAAAGEVWDLLVVQTILRGLGGFEALSGIPGLVGATPMQNVGAYGQHVSSVITEVQAIERSSGKLVTFTAAECDFGYRRSRFKDTDSDRYVITQVKYQLDPAGVPTINYPQLADHIKELYGVTELGRGTKALQQVREATLQLRRRKSMVVDAADPNTRSCGSFFVNPILTPAEFDALTDRAHTLGASEPIPHFPDGANVKVPAAWIIEAAGFTKGERRGGVGISANHPLALVNYEGTTKELLALAAEIQGVVHEKLGVELEREPVVV